MKILLFDWLLNNDMVLKIGLKSGFRLENAFMVPFLWVIGFTE